MPRLDLLQLRRGISSLWASRNPTLADGELVWDKTVQRLKIGDGSTAWNSLPYLTQRITVGTAAPSGGADGDIYLQIVS